MGPLSVGKNHKTKVIKLVHQNQWEHEEKSSKLPEARENADGQVATGLNFAFHDWLTERERVVQLSYSNHKAKEGKTKFWMQFGITIGTQLKIASTISLILDSLELTTNLPSPLEGKTSNVHDLQFTDTLFNS